MSIFIGVNNILDISICFGGVTISLAKQLVKSNLVDFGLFGLSNFHLRTPL